MNQGLNQERNSLVSFIYMLLLLNVCYCVDVCVVTSHAMRPPSTDIYIFAIGAELLDDDLQPLTVGTGGQHYFRMKDITELQETFDEIIGEWCQKANWILWHVSIFSSMMHLRANIHPSIHPHSPVWHAGDIWS